MRSSKKVAAISPQTHTIIRSSSPQPTAKLLLEDALLQNPQYLSWLPQKYRLLLHHFATVCAKSQSCNQIIQDEFCSVLVPMALETSHLLAALLNVASVHRRSLGVQLLEPQPNHLQTTAVQQLAQVLSKPSRLGVTTIATTLALCLGEIMSGGEKPQSWRLHLQGTTAIVRQWFEEGDYDLQVSEPTIRRFLWNWYVSFVTLACFNPEPSASYQTSYMDRLKLPYDDGYIDEFSGFSTNLIPIIEEINRLSFEQQSLRNSTTFEDSSSLTKANGLQRKCDVIVAKINAMLLSPKLDFRPELRHLLKEEDRYDYGYLNQAFHHVALVQLYRRVLSLPGSSDVIQISVKKILYCLSNMRFLPQPCPAVAAIQPIFTAGCEACDPEDKALVMHWMDTLEAYFGMGNVSRIRDFIVELWEMRGSEGKKSTHRGLEGYLGKTGASLCDNMTGPR